MNIEVDIDGTGEDHFGTGQNALDRTLVVSGYWEQGRYHGGHIEYYIARTNEDYWILESIERNTILDDVTEEDVEEGALNDDQIQAMWGMTLEEAQDQEYRSIVAVCKDAEEEVSIKEMAKALYLAVFQAGGKRVSERDDEDGIL